MKFLLKVIAPLLVIGVLAGCANQPIATGSTSAAQTQANLAGAQYRSCLLYQASQASIAKKVSTLPVNQAKTLYEASQQATTLCKSVFTNNNQAAAELTRALTTISLLAGVNLSQ